MMSPADVLIVSIAGGGGASARFFVDGLMRRSTRPWGTIVVNLSGSLLLGLLLGVGAAHVASEYWVVILGVGFLGGYTTFSTASFETVTLLRERRLSAAFGNAFGVLIAATSLAALGYFLGIAFANA